jgi:nucleotide-binding universal stress UspA family protein
MNDDTISNGAPIRPRRILIATDLSAASQAALKFASKISPPGSDVRIVSVAENPRTLIPLGSSSAAVLDTARQELLQDATSAVTRASADFARTDVRLDTDVIDLEKRGGDLVHGLLDCAHAWRADLLVLGADEHHGWLSRWVNGTVSESLAKLSHCPTLIVPTRDKARVHRTPERILFAIDGSEPALQALRFGLTFATRDAELRAIYVVDRAGQFTDIVPVDVLEDAFIEQGERALKDVRPMLEAACPHHSTAALISTAKVRDDVAQAILREAEKWRADLIVMGSHGRRGIARWLLGSVAGRVAHATHAPLLLVNSTHT